MYQEYGLRISLIIAPFVCSSDEGEGGLARITRCSGSAVRREASGGWSDDEFERDMESELMGLLETVASPDALVAAAAHRGRRRGVRSKYYNNMDTCTCE